MSEGHRLTDVCTPETGNLCDDNEGRADVIQTVNVRDVTGTLETHFLFMNACENKEQADLLLTGTREVSKHKSSKQRYLSGGLSE